MRYTSFYIFIATYMFSQNTDLFIESSFPYIATDNDAIIKQDKELTGPQSGISLPLRLPGYSCLVLSGSQVTHAEICPSLQNPSRVLITADNRLLGDKQ